MPMPNRYMQIPPGPDPERLPGIINMIVEIPRGRRSKFEVDKEHGLIKLDRYLYASAMYPGDYGFCPRTLAEDGDPLDVLVMVNEPTFSGCLIECRPLGLFKMTDRGENDFKVLAVPNTDPIFAEHKNLWRVPSHYLREVEYFFATYKELEGANMVKTQGWHDADAAHDEIMSCIERYENDRQRREGDGFKKDDSPKRRESDRFYAGNGDAGDKAGPDPVPRPKTA